MADVKPLKIFPIGEGKGELREFGPDDKIPQSYISDLAQSLDAKADKTEYQQFLQTIDQRVNSAEGFANSAQVSSFEASQHELTAMLQADRATEQAEKLAVTGGGHLFDVKWWPKRSSIPAGYVPADGQLLNRATYPDAWAGINAGAVPTASDAAWLGLATARGAYTPGDGSTTFRIPDYNGKSAGALGSLFLRGDGAGASSEGAIQADALQAHTHQTRLMIYSASAPGLASPSGGYETVSTNPDGFAGTFPTGPVIGANTSNETRPKNVAGVWVIKLFGAVTSEGSADAAQLATDVAALSASKLDAAPFFAMALGDNILMNPEFKVNQRNYNGDFFNLLTGSYGFDRWKKGGSDWQQVIEAGMFIPNSAYVLTTSAGVVTQMTSPDSGNWTVTVPTGLTWVKLQRGTVPTPFHPRPFGLEAILCQRYYEVTTLPIFFIPGNASATTIYLYRPFAVVKRATPSMSRNPFTTAVLWNWQGSDLNATVFDFFDISQYGTGMSLSAGGTGIGGLKGSTVCGVYITVNAEL